VEQSAEVSFSTGDELTHIVAQTEGNTAMG
jgi:hypothetical protein